jgi:SAM-dependent methyltransferase
MNYGLMVDQAIADIQASPIDLLNTGAAKEEVAYLYMLKDTYIRTIKDIDTMFNSQEKKVNILEIGSLYGVVSKSLKKIGYSIFALELPEFYQSKTLQALYKNAQIPFSGVNLRLSKLPYESNFFDAVILCEVIEHFNFNPLPTLKETNRVLKPGGLLYVGTPNLVSIKNRLSMIKGQSYRDPIEYYFQQLDKRFNIIVSTHWREYTMAEMAEMIEKMGFEIISHYYFAEKNTSKTRLSTRIKKKIAYSIPSFRPFQVAIAKKISEYDIDFWFTEANT